MSLNQWGMLLSIVGFIMATLFAALLMEEKVVGSVADWLSDAFGQIHSHLTRKFPLPRRRLIAVMYRYSVQTLALALSGVILTSPHLSIESLKLWVPVALIVVAGVLPLVFLYRAAWAEDGGEHEFYPELRLFTACFVHEIIMLLVSPFILLAIFLLEMIRFIFGFLSYSDDAKKILIILGTIVGFVGLIMSFVASFE